MAELKRKGDLAELKVATDLIRQGHKIALPYGEDWDADLIVEREGSLERVQVKHARSDGMVIPLRCYSQTIQAGRSISIKRYTAEMVDWMAVWDVTTDTCCYVPASELGEGRRMIHLRLEPPRNNQRRGIRMAADYGRLALPSAGSRGRGDNGNTRPLQG